MAIRTAKPKSDGILRPVNEGWYWYYATPEEQKELTVEEVQIAKVYRTKEGILMTEFIREVRRVSKLMGKWSNQLIPS